MPHVVNGVGTWYYGKRNVLSYPGVCEFCQQSATLCSYDTTLYAVLAFVPIIPLGSKRIVDECPKCTMHRALSLKKWEDLKANAVQEAIDKYDLNPTDPELADDALRACVMYQDMPAFHETVEKVEHHLPDHAETLQLLGDLNNHYGYYDAAERLYRQSLAAEDRDEAREGLAFTLAAQRRPDDMTPVVQHIIDKGIAEKVWLLALQARTYQALGRHDQALRVFAQCEALMPGLEKDKAYRKVKRKSERDPSSRKPVVAKDLPTPGKVGGAERDLGGAIARWTPSVVITVIFGLYIFFAWRAGQSRPVYLVNGLSRPYQVSINGETFNLGARANREIQLREGDITIEVVDKDLNLPPQTVTLRTSFWARPFLDRVYVINPDMVAPLIWEQTTYAPENEYVPENGFSSRLATGQALQEFSGLDYEFEEFPDTISVESGEVSKRQRIHLASRDSREIIAGVMQAHDPIAPTPTIELCRKHLEMDPADSAYLTLLRYFQKSHEMEDLLKTGLEKRPVLIDWHRAYQESVDTPGGHEELVAHYRTVLEKEPDNHELQYLLGRILTNPAESRSLFEKSTKGANPCAYGYLALAYADLACGEFEHAVPLARQAQEMMPDNLGASELYKDALLAAQRYDELKQRLTAEKVGKDPERDALRMYVYMDVIKQPTASIDTIVDRILVREYRRQIIREMDPIRDYLIYCAAYVSGDMERFLKLMRPGVDESPSFPYAICRGDVDAASSASAMSAEITEEPAPPIEHLLIYLIARRAGRDEVANYHFQQAVNKLYNGGSEQVAYAAALSGTKTPDPDLLCHLAIEPLEKCIILTALGVKYPEDREKYHAMARRLNFSRDIPYQTIKSILDGES